MAATDLQKRLLLSYLKMNELTNSVGQRMTSCLDSAAINYVPEVCSLYKLWKPLSCYPGIPERKNVALNNPHHQVQLLPRCSQGFVSLPEEKSWEIQLSEKTVSRTTGINGEVIKKVCSMRTTNNRYKLPWGRSHRILFKNRSLL